MSIRKAVVSRLRASAGLGALIGTGIAMRLFPDAIPKTPTFPLVVYRVISADHEAILEGAAGIAETRFQVDAFGPDKIPLDDIQEQIRLSLLSNAWWHTTTVSVFIHGAVLEDERDIKNPPRSGEDVELYGYSRDYMIFHDEVVP